MFEQIACIHPCYTRARVYTHSHILCAGIPMRPSKGGLQGLIEKAAPTLAATLGVCVRA